MRIAITSWRKKQRRRLSRLRRAEFRTVGSRSPLDMATAEVLRTKAAQKKGTLEQKPHARSLSVVGLMTCVDSCWMENCMSGLRGAMQMSCPTAVRQLE